MQPSYRKIISLQDKRRNEFTRQEGDDYTTIVKSALSCKNTFEQRWLVMDESDVRRDFRRISDEIKQKVGIENDSGCEDQMVKFLAYAQMNRKSDVPF